MKRQTASFTVAAIVVATLAACGTRPNPESCVNSPTVCGGLACNMLTGRCETGDGGADALGVPDARGLDAFGVDVGSPPDAEPAPDARLADVTVTITAPGAMTHTNAAVSFSVAVVGPAASVELRKNGARLAALSGVDGGAAGFSWDTRAEAEGSYTIAAVATRSDGVEFTSTAVTVVVDRTPPTVVTKTPAPGGANVSLYAPISVGFSEAVAPASVTSTTVTLKVGGADLAATRAVSADGKSLTVDITDKLALTLPATLAVGVTTGVQDLAGNAAVAADWSWSLPQWFKYPKQSGALLGVALTVVPGTDDPVIATNKQVAIGNYVSDVFRATSDLTWSSLGMAPTVAGATDVAASAMGDVFVVGSTYDANVGASFIRLAEWTAGAWKSDFQPLDAAPGMTPASGASVRLASDGAPIVAFVESAGGVTSEWVGKYDRGSQMWNGVYGSPGNADGVTLVLGSMTEPIMAGRTGATLTVNRYNPGTMKFELVGAGAVSDASATLAIGSDGALYTARIVNNAVQVVRSVDGAAWTNVGPALNAGTGGLVAGAQVRVDSAGRVVVAWAESESGTFFVRLARLPAAATTWDRSFGRLEGNPGVGSAAPRLELDAEGRPVVGWLEYLSANMYDLFVWRSNR